MLYTYIQLQKEYPIATGWASSSPIDQRSIDFRVCHWVFSGNPWLALTSWCTSQGAFPGPGLGAALVVRWKVKVQKIPAFLRKWIKSGSRSPNKNLGDTWKKPGRISENTWEIFGKYLGDIWKIPGRLLELQAFLDFGSVLLNCTGRWSSSHWEAPKVVGSLWAKIHENLRGGDGGSWSQSRSVWLMFFDWYKWMMDVWILRL